MSDYLTGVFAAVRRGGLSVRTRDTAGGGGEVVDAPLYGSVLRILEWTLAGYDRLGLVRRREGNRLSHSAPLDNYPTADGSYVCIVAGSDANFGRLCAAMERPDLASDPRFAALADRAAHGDEINGLVAAWTSALTAEQVTTRCVEHDVPVGTAYSSADIFADPHMSARSDLVSVDDPVLGPVRQQAPFPRLSAPPHAGARRRAAPRGTQRGGLVRRGGAERGRIGRLGHARHRLEPGPPRVRCSAVDYADAPDTGWRSQAKAAPETAA